MAQDMDIVMATVMVMGIRHFFGAHHCFKFEICRNIQWGLDSLFCVASKDKNDNGLRINDKNGHKTIDK